MALDNDKIFIDIQATVDKAKSAQSLGDLKSSLKELQSLGLQVGDTNAEALNKINKAAGEVADQIGDLKEGFKTLSGSNIENIGSSFAALKQKIISLDIEGASRQFSNLRLSIVGAAKDMLGLSESTTIASAAMRVLGGAIAATGIGALIIAAVVLIKEWDDLAKSSGFLGETIRSVTKWFKELYDQVVTFVVNGIQKAVDGFVELYNKSILVRGIVQGLVLGFKTLVEAWSTGASIIGRVLKTLGTAIMDIFQLRNPIDTLKKGFKEIEGDLVKFGVTFKDNFAKAVTETVNGQLKTVDIFGNFLKIRGKEAGKEAGKETGKAIKDGIDAELLQPITPASRAAAKEAMRKFLEQFKEEIKPINADNPIIDLKLEKKPEPIYVPYKADPESIKEFRESIAMSGLDYLAQRFSEIASQIGGVAGGVLNGFNQVFTSIGDSLSTFKDRVADFVDSGRNGMSEFTANVLAGVQSGLEAAEGLISGIGAALQASSEQNIEANKKETNTKLANLDRLYKAGKITEQQFALEQYKIKLDSYNKEKELRKKAFKQYKAIQIVQAVIGTAQGVVAALANPFPLNIVMAVLAGITGAIQIGLIAAQKFPEGDAAPSPPPPASIPSPGEVSSQSNQVAQQQSAPDNKFIAPQFFGLGGKQTSDQDAMQYQKVYVVESDITSTQRRVNVIEDRARIG